MTDKHLQLHRREFAFAALSAVAFSVIAVALKRLSADAQYLSWRVDDLYTADARRRSVLHDYAPPRPTMPDQPRPRSGKVD